MYILPNATEFNNACASQSRTIASKCEVWVGGSVVATMTGDAITGEIISMEWDNIVCSNDGLQIGTCCMDEFKMTYRPVATTISLMGKEIHPYVGMVIGNDTTYVPLGVFYVTDVSSDDEDRTFNITAYDGMQKMLGDFSQTELGINFPINAWTLVNTIASHFGFTVDYRGDFSDLVTSDDLYLHSVEPYQLQVGTALESNRRYNLTGAYEGTYRDYIGWIVGLVGAFAHMGRDGELVISRYVDYDFDVARSVQHMGGSKINYGGSVTYMSIVSGTDENPIYPTNYGGNAITYTNPYMTSEILDTMCDYLIGQNGITVTPCDVTWRSNPCIDAGDIVGIEDKDGNMSSTYVMERVMTVTGGLVETLHCYGETEVMHTLNKSPLVTKLTQITQDAKDFAELINGTNGTFQFIDNGDGTNGGFTIYEDGTSSWLRCTAGGIGISEDGGLTYTNAITKNGVVANRLNVEADGVRVIQSFYNPNNGNANAIVAYDTYYNNLTLWAFSRRWVTENGYSKGDTYFRMYDAKSNIIGIEMNSGYWDEEGFAPPGSYIRLNDSTNGYMKIMLDSYGTATSRNALFAMYNYDGSSNNEMFSVRVFGNSTPYMSVFDTSADILRTLTLRPITINGTTYYMFAST